MDDLGTLYGQNWLNDQVTQHTLYTFWIGIAGKEKLISIMEGNIFNSYLLAILESLCDVDFEHLGNI